ncbi:MAG: hypothetical protein P1V18_05105 [Candidatus Gracilibacteria bacterium]|nr:hypothetical protein [Candidatus Gracilibacteria bacterium]
MEMLSSDKIQQLFHSARYNGLDVCCVYCRHQKLYIIENGKRYKCSGCQKKFRDWTSTALDGCRLQPEVVYSVLLDFCNGSSALQVSKKHILSYQTVFDLYNRIRDFLPVVQISEDLSETYSLFAYEYVSRYRGIQKNQSGYEKELKWRFSTHNMSTRAKVKSLLDILLSFSAVDDSVT